MSKVTRFAIINARFTWLLVLAVVLAGVQVYLSQPRQEDPEITLRSAQVVTRFPGLSPERVEQLLTKPVENAIKTMAEVDTIKSVSMTGMSIVTPEVKSQYTDMKPLWATLRNKMKDLSERMPSGALAPQVNDDYGRVAVVTLALTGKDFSHAELFAAARDIQDFLGSLPLVGRVDLYGVQDEHIWIDFDPAFMAQFGLKPAEIVKVLKTQNVVLSGGVVEASSSNVVIEPSGNFRSVDDIGNVVIAAEGGQLVYLRDLASVRRGYVDPPQAPVFFNSQPALVIGLSMVEESNVVELGRQVRDALVKIRRNLPLGVELEEAIFQPDLVQQSVYEATENLLQTVAVVLVVVMVSLGLRAGLIVGAMVPLTMMATLIGMSVWGIELHRVSIAAVIVALGLLVDNGVVIVEGIKKRLDEGVDRFEAALETTASLAFPLLISSLTTVAAFAPLMLISGGSGEFLVSLGQVLSLALLSSWLIAITVLPAFCVWFFLTPTALAERRVGEDGKPLTRTDSGFYARYRSILSLLLRFRVWFVVIMIILLLSSFVVFGYVPQRSLGPSERNQFVVYIDLPAASPIRETLQVVERVSHFLQGSEWNPEVENVLAYVGGGGPRFFLSLAPNDARPHKAFLVVTTTEADQIAPVMSRVEHFLKREVPEANGRADILFLGESPLGTVQIEINGSDIEILRRITAQVEGVFHSVEGVTTISNDWENSVLKLVLVIDQERARRAGVTSEEVSRTLSAYFDGAQITTLRDGELSVPVLLRANADARGSLDGVRMVEIFSSVYDAPVPLLQIGDFRGQVEPSQIRRVDQVRTITVSAKHPDKTSNALYKLVKERIESIERPSDYSLEVAGEIRDSAESNRDLFQFAPHALFVILSLLVFQFNSMRRAFVILLTIPLVLIGAIYGLWGFGGFFDFTALLGLFSLAGIIINNGIVLIDRIDEVRSEEGVEVDEAIIKAALERARPIVMTTVTTVVGLVPLALFGGEFWYGMAIVIMCGLGIGSVLTLAFVPVLYSLFFRGLKGAPNHV